MNQDQKQLLLTKYKNCAKLIMHNENLNQGMLKFYFAFVAGVFVLLGFIVTLTARGQNNLGGTITEVMKNFDVVGGVAIIWVIFTQCLGICSLYLHRSLRLKNINLSKTMTDIEQTIAPDIETSPSITNTDIYYARIFAFSNSMFLLCLIVLLGLFTRLTIIHKSGLIITMTIASFLAIIFYFIQIEHIFIKKTKTLGELS